MLFRSGAFGDSRADQVRVDILGNGRILRTARVRMNDSNMPWLRTVVAPRENHIGNPVLRSFTRSGVTMHGTNTRLPILGMRPEEIDQFDNPALKPEWEEEEEGFDPSVRKPSIKREQ